MKKFVLAMMTFCFAVSMVAQSYYVAGNGKEGNSFCDGKEWNSDGSLMSGNPATITFSNVAAGEYKFKVTDGTWNDPVFGYASYTGSTPVTTDDSDNIVFTLSETSDVTIVFDGTNITALIIGGGSIGTYYVAGNGGSDSNGSFCGGFDWSTDTSPMSGNPATITFSNVAPETYKFKVTDGTWNDPVFGYASYTGSTPVTTDDSDNIVFTLSESSNVTIVFDGTNITELTIGKYTDINNINSDEATILGNEYYTLQGVKLQDEPATGMFIVKMLKADGSVKSQKVIK